MHKLLALLFSLLLISPAVGQTTPKVVQLKIVPEMYSYETYNFMIPDGAIFWVDDVTQDSLLVFAKAFWSKNPAQDYMGVCFNGANEAELQLDSLVVGAYSPHSSHIFKKTLSVPGQSEIVNVAIPLQDGRVVFIREVFRRKFECGAGLWFILLLNADNEGP